MQKNEAKMNQLRKPLGDLSNSYIASKSQKKMMKNMVKPLQNEIKARGEYSPDLLILAQSEFSSISRQLEEIIAQAAQQKTDIDSFLNSFSEMLSSLKPWVCKLKKLIPSTHPTSPSTENRKVNITDFCKKTVTNSMISPSPLVSWRAGCTVEAGRPLFMLTPLPISKTIFSSRHRLLSKSIHSPVVSFLEEMPEPPAAGDGRFERSPVVPAKCVRPTGTTSPCVKMSPIRSCLLLERIPEADDRPGERGMRRSLDLSDSPICEVSKSLDKKYKEILREKMATGRRWTVEDSPGWLQSPPKTRVLMNQPVGDDSLAAVYVSQWKVQSLKKGDIHGGGVLGERTPLPWGGNDGRLTTTGKHPGETTLKRELWTRFDAASIGESNGRPFLEKLDEAFLDDEHGDR